MCDPVSIGSAALTAFGTLQQYQSQKKAADRVEQAVANNAQEQERLRQNSQAGVQDSAQQFSRDKFDKTQSDETATIEKKLTDSLSQGDLPGEYYGGRESANTKQYAQTKSMESTDFSRQMAEALAKMRGFDAGMGKTNLGINRASEKVVMNNGFMDGNNAVLPLQIEAAKQSGQNPLADIMVGVGSAGLQAGLSGGSGPMTTGTGAGKITWNTGRNGVPYNKAQKFFGSLV